jgi:cytochrome c oxidase subunit I
VAQAALADRVFSTCDTTGFRIEDDGRKLALWNGVAGVVLLLVGGVMALLIAIQRLEAVTFISNDLWYRLLAAHGTTLLLFWLLFFEVAALYWGSTVLLNAPMRLPRVAWGVFGLMIGGVVLAEWAMLTDFPVMFTAYPPMETAWYYYLGILMVAVGVLAAIVLFFVNVVGARRDGYYEGSLPLVTYGIGVAGVIGVFALLAGAVAYGALFLKSIGLIESVDPAFYRLFFWGIGHGAQQVNLAAMVAVWYALAGLTVGARPVNEGLSRFAFLLLLAFIHLGAVHHLLVDPGLGTSHRLMNTSYLLYLAVLASLIHGLTVPGAIEVTQRQKGLNRGLFEWLRKAPWGNPVFSGMFISLVGFGFIGGISGVVMGAEQINFLIHNTIYVPGHFHGTVALGTTLAFMAITYWLVPVLFRKQLVLPRLAQWQPYMFGIGTALQAFFMMGAGTVGVSRRHWDMGFAGSAFEWAYSGVAYTMMALNGVSALLAVAGGAAFVVVIVGTILFGKPTGVEAKYTHKRPQPLKRPVAEAVGTHGSIGAKGFSAPGTFMLAMFLMLVFVVYYFVNYGYLATVWRFS